MERAKTAKEAVGVITALLTEHGQGGLCSEDHNFGQWTYHNSFVVADAKEAWLLETAGKFWAAKKVSSELLCETITVTSTVRSLIYISMCIESFRNAF